MYNVAELLEMRISIILAAAKDEETGFCPARRSGFSASLRLADHDNHIFNPWQFFCKQGLQSYRRVILVTAME
jgi:hypothetical protein